MNNNMSGAQKLGTLFTDAAREVVEKNRIKAQMNRISEIVELDKRRLNGAYSEIGRMYCEGTLEKNGARVEMLNKTIAYLKKRIERAGERYDQLKIAHSVDECTEAFKAELQSKVSKAQQATAEYARDLKEKAKVAAKDFSDKTRAAAGDLSDKATETFGNAKNSGVAAKARITAEEIVARAVAATRKVKEAKKASKATDDASSWDSFDEQLDDLIYDDAAEDDGYIEEYSEDDKIAAADISEILQNIAFVLEEVEGDADKAVAEEVSEEAAEAAVEATQNSEEAPAQEANSEESPEGFTF